MKGPGFHQAFSICVEPISVPQYFMVAQPLRDILKAAYECPNFVRNCSGKVPPYDPQEGQIPRGYAGATGSISDVLLILCVAEPADPQKGNEKRGISKEWYDGTLSAELQVDHIADQVGGAFFNGTGAPYHRNLRYLLDQCWPEYRGQPEEQLKRTWIAEGVLCSALRVGRAIPACVEQVCVDLYLRRQLAILPDAFVVALGRKAERRLKRAGLANGPGEGKRTFFPVRAAGMPIGKREEAQKGWDAAGAAFRAHLKNKGWDGNRQL